MKSYIVKDKTKWHETNQKKMKTQNKIVEGNNSNK